MLIISILLIFFAGASEAIMDKLQFHFDKSIFSNKDKYKQLFWNPIDSWKNKWKEDLKTKGDKAREFGIKIMELNDFKNVYNL